MLYGAGLWLAETLALRPADVDTEGCIVRVREGKGRRSRTVGIDRHSATVLARWLDRRPQLGLTGRHPIFATHENRQDRPPTRTALRAAIVWWGMRPGIRRALSGSLSIESAERASASERAYRALKDSVGRTVRLAAPHHRNDRCARSSPGRRRDGQYPQRRAQQDGAHGEHRAGRDRRPA